MWDITSLTRSLGPNSDFQSLQALNFSLCAFLHKRSLNEPKENVATELSKSKIHSEKIEIQIVLSEIPLYWESLKGSLSLVVFSGVGCRFTILANADLTLFNPAFCVTKRSTQAIENIKMALKNIKTLLVNRNPCSPISNNVIARN